MAVVRAFAVEGCSLWFWSCDHEPPHFHVKRTGQWEVKVFFLLDPDEMIVELWAERPPARKTLRAITDLARRHRVELLDQWDEIHNH
ncbi:MAG: DUF4160 domain-containing protein [Pirellulaceae bacterium]|nr:DUF4160 domain-containing protein [Pirellulaceae bacterium]